MLEGFLDLINAFSALNPFDLAYFSETLLVQFEDVIANRDADEALQFTQQDIKHAVICAMRILKVEAAESQVLEAKTQLSQTQRQTHMPRRISLIRGGRK